MVYLLWIDVSEVCGGDSGEEKMEEHYDMRSCCRNRAYRRNHA